MLLVGKETHGSRFILDREAMDKFEKENKNYISKNIYRKYGIKP